MPPLFLQCLYLLLFACTSLVAYLFPDMSEKLFYCLPGAERLQSMVGPPGAFRFRLMMWLTGSAAAPVFAAILIRTGLEVAPACQPRKLKGLGWLFFAAASSFLSICWMFFFVMIFAGPVWVQFEPFYALMLIGLFTLINANAHLLILKIRTVLSE